VADLPIGVTDSWYTQVLLVVGRLLASFDSGLTNGADNRVWLITGASSGFGRAITEAALARGDSVAAGARTADAFGDLPEGVHPLALDVTNSDQREAAVAETVERFGRVDVLVNNAGRTQVGAVEETSDEELRSLFELHFFAPAALTRLVLPHMRRQGGGAIVQMSSVGGQVTAPGFGAYCATKYALEGLTETLRDEVAGFGIRTLIVEPGAFRTGLFRPGAAYESDAMAEYADTVGPTRAYVRTGDGLQAGDPAKAAQAILTAVDSDEPPLRLVLGADAVGNIERRLKSLSDELAAWRALGEATAVDEQ
jgi:NAD(P)-dependent dehydrogenase (short-subunit alcohol dehydrogenase family)